MASQFKETAILQKILDQCGPHIVPVCCDVGAMHAKWYSNVFELWHDRGWSAILIERHPMFCQKMEQETKGFPVQVMNTTVTPQGPESLDEIFRRHTLDPHVGVLSIDVDSFDYYIFKYLTYVQPQIVIIEFNHLIDPAFTYCDPEDDVYLRSSLAALRELAEAKGYRMYAVTECNAIFVLNALAAQCAGRSMNGHVMRARRERMITFFGFALGTSNYYPIFLRHRAWPYRRTVQAFMWCACRLMNWRPVRETMRREKRQKAFLKPSPRMQTHLQRYGMDV